MAQADILPCLLSELDFFEQERVQAGVVAQYVEVLQPLSSLQGAQTEVLEFSSAGRPLALMDLGGLRLRFVVYLRKRTGENLTANDDKISTVNCLLHAMIRQCEIFLNEKCITKSPQDYALKSYLDILTSAHPASTDGHTSTFLFSPDESPDSPSHNEGWTNRLAHFKKSNRVELVGYLRDDAMKMMQNLFILDQVNLRVKLGLNSQDMFLWSKSTGQNDVELVIEKAELSVPYFKISPDLSIALERVLTQKPAVYRFNATQIKTFVHPALSSTINLAMAFSGKLPNSLLLTFQKSKDFSPNIKNNPFYFPHCNVEEISVFVNGQEQKIQLDMESDIGCCSALKSIYDTFGFKDENSPANLYTLKNLRNGQFAVAFDLTIDKSGRSNSHNLDLHGTLRIQAKLKEALNETIVVVVYACFPSRFEITADREVILL
ncbi:hypothetical protein KUF71_017375 [Frankliniella fusca]|uniref:Uncharacterized protein n=1 Tax=Frankliniella fusca TaxID=407009 RepID=A0AAE1IX58_9NEOP|nr:hypothetical protein KUF71_004121 [Frankliniella fusca]KAK3911333.1 hypothetical protein KUF71_021114 [Frankliniella fusca]KAK3916817.1 hypothetical protein KUF71_025918 [Frankliniella fusca]KAK3932941.1 hypothetical protein KUF71_016407 [Frankliniella fusca]KAK3933114.1 hypothetical protein KUF71_017375 [Frankliniella fusca]